MRLETLKLALAQTRRGVALKTLAERHGWKLRTLYHDIDALSLAGYQVVNEDGRFRLEEPGPAMPGAPTADERLALLLARQQASAWKHTSLGRALDRLWHRLSSAAGGQAALLPTESASWITARAWAAIEYDGHKRLMATLERAVRERLPIQARYRAISTGAATDRVIEPGQLHWDPALECLYLIGWCRLRRDVRVFAVHRFLAATLLDDRCEPRPETSSAAALKRAFRVWRSVNIERVRVWFAPEVAEEIRERRWLPEQRIETAHSGGVVVSGEVAGLAEVERWVLGYGAAARVLGPEGLVARVNRSLELAARGYATGSLPSAGKRRA